MKIFLNTNLFCFFLKYGLFWQAEWERHGLSIQGEWETGEVGSDKIFL